MNTITPNPADGFTAEELANANAVVPPADGTEQKPPVQSAQEIEDYREKFIQSAKGAHELLEEKKRLEAEIAQLRAAGKTPLTQPNSPNSEILYPGFEDLDPEAQANLIAYSNALTERAKSEILSDPSIAFARKNYNDSKWDIAFSELTAKYPELVEAKGDFKTLYYNPNNVPDNIGDILETVAKSYLFDKARDIGAKEGEASAQRVQLEDPTGGDKTPSVHRSLADWQRLAQINPAKFAAMKKEYEADLASGKLKE